MYTVLVTGGVRGIGKAIANKYRQEGYKVIAPDREECNLAAENSVEEFIRRYQDERIDIIVNNAGVNDVNLIDEITDEELEQMMQVNLISPIRLIRGFARNMKKNNFGRIVNIGSIWAVVSKGGRTVYSATKHGIHGVTKTLAVELAPYNILVNTVCPGFTLTDLTRKNNDAEAIAKISREIPLGRMAEPEEIANVVYFFGNENNTYLTGQKITVDGGYTSQ
ncbi:SDR family NAD(P)-dependent oxidoreductase [Selenomonas ruminantium]|uniref:3-oxoacyl-[acyl-carrier protein] reductase n=1 Tax=Selenomonas ruminantium TaxID=971 RepID=A0A1H0S0B0_SELRU|nr:SDR family oxidoreductase [Selenomonas ruminantium]SDP35261.1 3-oxoacyl-[acyl-carrier protein] reductase [Selenomonas ruminantium]